MSEIPSPNPEQEVNEDEIKASTMRIVEGSSTPEPELMTEDEKEQIFKLTDQFSRPQALAKVLGEKRARQVIATESRSRVEQSSQEAQAERAQQAIVREAQQADEMIDLLRKTDPTRSEKPGGETGGDHSGA